MGDMCQRSASGVRIFLSATVSPRVQAPSRWTAVNALTRKAFAIAGKDGGSPFLHFLATGRSEESLATYTVAVQSLGVDEALEVPGLLHWYRRLNHNYPFLDYSKAETRAVDADLMHAYASTEDAPSLVTPWPEDGRGLAPGCIESSAGSPQAVSEQLAAGWLRLAAGFTQVRQLSHSTIAFRTSPSGGARHPTDVGIHMGPAWPQELSGSWWYDPLEHRLRRALRRHVSDASRLAADAVVFPVSSHVRRAMWRYRDVRAFRPVVIDAGHVVETLLAVIQASGWHAWWQPSVGFVDAGGDLDPLFGYVIATPTPDRPEALRGPASEADDVPTTSLRTNPLLSLVATSKELFAENHLRGNSPLAMTPGMIDALAYAIPSSRQDRPTGIDDILAAHAISPRDLEKLVSAGLLLPEADGNRLWAKTQTWSSHDWYLSLLAHCSEVAPSAVCPVAIGPLVPSPGAFPLALDQRRTTRTFTDGGLPLQAAERLLASLTVPLEGVSVILSATRAIGTLDCGTYVVVDGRCEFKSSDVPTAEDVIAAAIGQPWARGFACVVWLVPVPAPSVPGAWESALIECGRAAQRIALSLCDDPLVGVFQSPALVDDRLIGLLHDHASVDGAYMIGIGVTEAPSPSSPARFQPSALFAPHAKEVP